MCDMCDTCDVRDVPSEGQLEQLSLQLTGEDGEVDLVLDVVHDRLTLLRRAFLPLDVSVWPVGREERA